MPKNKQELAPVVTQTEPVPGRPARVGAAVLDAAQRSAKAGLNGAQAGLAMAGRGAGTTARVVSRAGAAAAATTVNVGSSAVKLVGDLNGDGKVDEADLAIARAAVAKSAAVVGRGAKAFASEVAKNDITKDAAAGAVVGALIAVPIPFVGPPAGAAMGAAIGMARGVLGADLPNVVGGVISAATAKAKPKRRTPVRKK